MHGNMAAWQLGAWRRPCEVHFLFTWSPELRAKVKVQLWQWQWQWKLLLFLVLAPALGVACLNAFPLAEQPTKSSRGTAAKMESGDAFKYENYFRFSLFPCCHNCVPAILSSKCASSARKIKIKIEKEIQLAKNPTNPSSIYPRDSALFAR